MSFLTTLQFWRDIEMFQVFNLDEVIDGGGAAQWIDPLSPVIGVPPWIAPDVWGLDPEYLYGYDLFLGVFDKSAVYRIVQSLYDADEFAENFDESRDLEGSTCVLRLGIGSNGEFLFDDCRLATLPWALTRLQNREELALDAFDTFASDLIKRLLMWREEREGNDSEESEESGDDTPMIRTWSHVQTLQEEVRTGLKIEWERYPNRVVIVPHRLRKKRVGDLGETQGERDGEKLIEVAPGVGSDTTAAEENIERLSPLGHAPSPAADAVLAAQLRLEKIDGNGKSEPPLVQRALARDMRSRIRRRYDILNSFYLRDLQRVAQRANHLTAKVPLYSYLGGEAAREAGGSTKGGTRAGDTSRYDSADRFRVDKPSEEFWKRVSPSALPLGRWPHAVAQVNSLMQQFAVNEQLSRRHRLFSVNGPPGTGKTTMIKDIVAATVVQRALRLVKYRNPDQVFEKEGISFELDRSRVSFPQLKRDLTGFEVVVVSSNNNAVENITRELPQRDNLGSDAAHAAYLPEVARLYECLRRGMTPSRLEEPLDSVWGFVSCPLGNKRNREVFCDALMYGPREEKEEKVARQRAGRYLTLHEWRKQIPPQGLVSFAKARVTFLGAHKKVEEIVERLRGVAEQVVQGSAERDRLFDSAEVQERAPWLTEELQEAQSALFLAALDLHQAWVREAQGVGQVISALGKLLASPERIAPANAKPLWQALFMIVPVVSSTLASVERMCAPLTEGSIGTVIIEEAGQATPQSVAGVLWRAKRALVIGDPMQIEPVISIPDVLIRHFAQSHGVTDPVLSPLASSAQVVADASNPLGVEISTPENVTWVGCPLRVHRRCLEPMFSISNTVAYGGLMTFGTTLQEHEYEALASLPASTWFDVPGAISGKHWVAEQGRVAADLLLSLCPFGTYDLPDIFFITPFRSVKEQLAQYLMRRLRQSGYPASVERSIRSRVGTVHTFQGKEASIVVFVLGCDESSRGAARWAGEKPNILNVAVTRARHRLYVIGALSLWHNKGVFAELASVLPRSRG